MNPAQTPSVMRIGEGTDVLARQRLLRNEGSRRRRCRQRRALPSF